MTTRGRRGGTAGLVALVAAWVVGVVAALATAVVVWDRGGICPDFEDEGPTAAPGSPYAAVVCEPLEVPFRWSTLAAAVLALVLVVVAARAWRRGAGRRLLVAGLLGALLGPALLQLVLHAALPRDCLSGREDFGPCARDREDT